MVPLRIHTQQRADQCTSCALAAIAEWVLKQPVNPDYTYYKSKDHGKFGILPRRALDSVVSDGVQLETGEIVFPFNRYRRVWGWGNLFGAILKALERGPVFCGCYWQAGWNETPYVSLPDTWETYGAHAFAVIGVIEKNDIIYVQVQNSRGAESGDNGIWYFPSEVVNRFSFAYQLYEKSKN